MKERRNTWLMILTLLPLLISDGILTMTGVSERVVGYVIILDCVFVGLLYIKYGQRPSLPLVILTLIYGTVLFSSLIHGQIKLAVLNFIGGLTACMVFDLWLKRSRDRFLLVCQTILVSMVLVNFITVLIFPDGMYHSRLYSENWFLGHKNSHFEYMMMGSAVMIIRSYFKSGRVSIPCAGFMVLCCLSLLLTDSLTALFMMLIFTLVVLLLINRISHPEARCLLRISSLPMIIGVTILMFAGIIVMYNNEQMLSILTEFSQSLGRKTPFNGRIPIWNASIKLIKDAPLLGYGILNPDDFVALSHNTGGTHAHSYLLNIMVMGGVVCLAEHVWLYGVTIYNFYHNTSFLTYVMTFVIGLYFLAGITSINFYSNLFNPVFILAFYISSKKELNRNSAPQESLEKTPLKNCSGS